MPFNIFFLQHQTDNVELNFSIINLDKFFNQEMGSWSLFMSFGLKNVLNQSWTVNILQKNVWEEMLRNLIKESKNFLDFVPWFSWVDNILDVFFVFLSYLVELDKELSPLILVRNAADNKFIQGVAKWHIFQIRDVLQIFSMESNFF